MSRPACPVVPRGTTVAPPRTPPRRRSSARSRSNQRGSRVALCLCVGSEPRCRFYSPTPVYGERGPGEPLVARSPASRRRIREQCRQGAGPRRECSLHRRRARRALRHQGPHRPRSQMRAAPSRTRSSSTGEAASRRQKKEAASGPWTHVSAGESTVHWVHLAIFREFDLECPQPWI